VSLDASRWAWKQSPGRSTSKLVLLAIADRAGADHSAFPSVATLQQDTGLDRKTVLKAIGHLESLGLLAARRQMGSSTVYCLIGVEDRHQRGSAEIGTGTKNGTSPKTGTPPVPFLGHHQSQKRDTNLLLTYQEPLKDSGDRLLSQPDAAAPRRRAPAKQPRFSPPGVADVAEYCRERGNRIDAEHFHAYYTANGWRVGKTSMRDWRAAVRTWEKRDEKHEQYSAGPKKSDFERNLEFLKRRSGEII
jgi:hypothetical protein